MYNSEVALYCVSLMGANTSVSTYCHLFFVVGTWRHYDGDDGRDNRIIVRLFSLSVSSVASNLCREVSSK